MAECSCLSLTPIVGGTVYITKSALASGVGLEFLTSPSHCGILTSFQSLASGFCVSTAINVVHLEKKIDCFDGGSGRGRSKTLKFSLDTHRLKDGVMMEGQ
jgi:hypothetical protein